MQKQTKEEFNTMISKDSYKEKTPKSIRLAQIEKLQREIQFIESHPEVFEIEGVNEVSFSHSDNNDLIVFLKQTL